ncbi:MAG: CvpA family protein [Deltaproteobacteria bacterium]|nr:MAG: CvpA family protein [Deltaproteobacteria bacterium]
MNAVDLLLLASAVLPGAWGAWRGLLGGAVGLFALVSAGLAGLYAAEPAGRFLLGGAAEAPLAGFAFAALAAYVGVRLLGAALRRSVRAAGLGVVDHLAGGVLSAAVGAVAGAWLVSAPLLLLPAVPSVYRGSLLAPQALLLACGTGLPCGTGRALPMAAAAHQDRAEGGAISALTHPRPRARSQASGAIAKW